MKSAAFLLILILCINATATAQQHPYKPTHGTIGRKHNTSKVSKYKLAQFDGRWQEISSIDNSTKEPLALTDTIYIHFYDGNKADTKQGNSVTITGSTEIDGDDYLSTSVNDYKIIAVSDKQIILDDLLGATITLEKRESFYYEDKPVEKIVVATTKKDVIELTKANLIKAWYSYKKEAAPGFIQSATPLIAKLIIAEKNGDNTYKGNVEYSISGKSTLTACILTITGNRISIATTNKLNWGLEVYKADGNEIVMGKKGELVYYFKPQ